MVTAKYLTHTSQEAPTIKNGAEGRIDIAYTLSKFRVKKVISGESLKDEDTFTMLENEAYDQEKKITYHIAGYNLIEADKNYLLILRHSETDPYYIVSGVNYGKVSLEETETDYPKGLKDANTDYSKEILFEYAKQEKIRNDARTKYDKDIKPFIN
ncbi:hypothetical protein IGI37_003029 [Enterococcus sp. AZ194]